MSGQKVVDGTLEWIGYQQINDLSSATTLTVPTRAGYPSANLALIQALDQNVRWRPDGTSTAPTASVGMQLEAGKDIWYTGDLATLKFIEEVSGAELNISYYTA